MLLLNKLQKDYSKNQSGYQLKALLNLETIHSVSPRTLLKIVLYSYMNGDYSSRSMELNCKRNIKFMFLLEGSPAPAHATFAQFQSIHLDPCSKRILSEEGILFRTNRSIQAEGAFGDLKQDMQFRRYLSKGTSNDLQKAHCLPWREI